jgi:hypothetical protein
MGTPPPSPTTTSLDGVAASLTAPISTTPRPNATLQLPAQALDWLAKDSRARSVVHSVWDMLTELQRAGQYPGTINALRRVLTQHQPTSTGRCRTCRYWGWRRRFP